MPVNHEVREALLKETVELYWDYLTATTTLMKKITRAEWFGYLRATAIALGTNHVALSSSVEEHRTDLALEINPQVRDRYRTDWLDAMRTRLDIELPLR